MKRSALRATCLLSTLPDGSGRQILTAPLAGDETPRTVRVRIELGKGIAEAVIAGGALAEEAITRQNDELDAIAVSMDAFRLSLSAALAESLAAGLPPPSELTEISFACGFGILRPRSMTAADWLVEIDPGGDIAGLSDTRLEALLARGRHWPRKHPMTGTWSEGTSVYADVVGGVSEAEDVWRGFWSLVEARRDRWTMLMLGAAHVLKAGESGDWREFAATGAALLRGRALSSVPFMGHVFDATSAAWRAERSRRRTNAHESAGG